MNALLKAGKTILNAMAFANAGNMREFETMLNATDMEQERQAAPQGKTVAHGHDHLRHATPAV